MERYEKRRRAGLASDPTLSVNFDVAQFSYERRLYNRGFGSDENRAEIFIPPGERLQENV